MLNELKEKQKKGKQNTQVERESQKQLHEVLKQVADTVSKYIAPSSPFYIYQEIKVTHFIKAETFHGSTSHSNALLIVCTCINRLG